MLLFLKVLVNGRKYSNKINLFYLLFYLDTRTNLLGNSELGNKNPKWAKQPIHV